MQQDNSNIEDKLRQLENQQLPDLSKMDAHWQQMQQMLDLQVNAPKNNTARFLKPNSKILFSAASVTAIVLCLLLLKKPVNNNREKTRSTTVNSTIKETKKQAKSTGQSDTIYNQTTNRKNSKHFLVILNEPVAQNYQADNKLNNVDSSQHIDSGLVAKNNEGNYGEKLLNNFYDRLQKPAQEFIVDVAKGGMIVCKEGTVVAIPASAFMDEQGKDITADVKITVEEYYKYSDIIAANLTTMSHGKQLVTGGMVKLTAMKDGRTVELKNNKVINLSMPAYSYDPGMQLFVSDKGANKVPGSRTGDTTATSNSNSALYRKINWQLSGNQLGVLMFDGKTNFMNMQDDPDKVRRNGKVAVFRVPKGSPYSLEEAKKILQEKYGDHYRTIKVRRGNQQQRVFNWGLGNSYVFHSTVGDSTRLTLNEAIRRTYIDKKDSAFYAEKIRRDSINYMRMIANGQLFSNGSYLVTISGTKVPITDSLKRIAVEQQKTARTYSFEIKKMGWINCDLFYSYPSKTDFVINLPEDTRADKFVTQLVFTNIRSVMPGQHAKNKIGFLNIPKDMPVYLVGLGEKDGKVVSFMEKFRTGEAEVNISNFEETTPEAFRNKLSNLDLQ